MAEIARKLLTTKSWLKKFGRLYGISDVGYLRQLCKNRLDNPRAGRFPEGWRARQLGNRHYLFFDSSTITRKTANDRAFPRPAIPEQVVNQIRSMSAKGLRKGEQCRLAAKLGISESHFSRIRRNLMRKASLTPSKSKLLEHGMVEIEAKEVDAVLNRLLTTQEWLDNVGKPAYGINDISYVNQMAARKLWGNSKTPAKLPAGWNSIRIGDSWLIYHKTLKTRAHWMNQ